MKSHQLEAFNLFLLPSALQACWALPPFLSVWDFIFRQGNYFNPNFGYINEKLAVKSGISSNLCWNLLTFYCCANRLLVTDVLCPFMLEFPSVFFSLLLFRWLFGIQPKNSGTSCRMYNFKTRNQLSLLCNTVVWSWYTGHIRHELQSFWLLIHMLIIV